MTFIILLKPYAWEKSGSQVNAKMLSANQIAGFLKNNWRYLKSNWRYKVDFLHAGTYLLKLQMLMWFWDDVVRLAQACPKRLLKLSVGPFSCNLFLFETLLLFCLPCLQVA